MSTWPAVALRYRVFLLASAAVLLGLVNAAKPSDMDTFAAGGQAIVSGHFGVVYAHAANQAGPVQLVLNWLLMIGSAASGPSRLVVVIVNVGLVLAAIGLCRRYGQRNVVETSEHRAAVARREFLVGVLLLLWLTPGGLWDGHPVEVLVAVLWLVAVDSVNAGRWVRAGLALAVAAAIAPWGVLGFPAVLACRRLDGSYRAGAAGIAIAALLYSPFLLSGHFAVFGFTWVVSPGTLIHLVLPGLHQVTWTVRLLQAAVVVGCTGCVALLMRRQRVAAPVAVLVAGVLRVATDPVKMDYYWTSVGLAAIVIVAMTPYPERTRWAATAAYVAWAGTIPAWTFVAAGICLALAVPIAATLRERPEAELVQSRVSDRNQLGAAAT